MKLERVSQFTTALKNNSEPEAHEDGSTVYRGFMPSERYLIDFAGDFTEAGWEQFDTSQDAEYFGFWVNRRTRQTLTYCEGDWILVECPTDEIYNRQILDATECYDEGRVCRVVHADGTALDVMQDRARFLIGAPDTRQPSVADVLA